MRWKRLRRLRLAPALLLLLLPALLVVSLVELRVTALDVHQAANTAYDRSLLGALKSIDANVSTESGGLSVELPYRMFEFFELTASGPVHYRVATADGLVELGSADLPLPAARLRTGVPEFYDGVYFGEPVRLVAYTRDLERPTAESPAKQLIIQVAESMRSRDEFKQVFIRRAAIENVFFLALTVGLAILAVVVALRPLAGLSTQIANRDAADLSAIPGEGLPADIRPVVDAMNQHMRRIEQLASQQREFLDDASHQLRTHLTTLRMQVDYALREPDPAQVHDAVAALGAELQHAMRSTQQLLSLGRSDTAALEPAEFGLNTLLEEVAREFLPQARAKGLDLGLEGEPQRAIADAGLLREAVSNLVANAIAYTQGSITLSCAADAMGWAVSVEDTGPGLPADLQRTAGSRFVRAAGGQRTGSGLGLAIVRSIAARHGGVLRLEPAERHSGLRASLWWPRPADNAPTP
ncbi:MAG: sensor histidine kinase [Burkholderiales bacterium]|nr:sensor histidine kinase [Burkholderiales bacterium]